MSVCVGFDLDMTLIDPRPGMVDVVDALAEETGIPLDSVGFADALGPPLYLALRAAGAPEERLGELVPRFRELYPMIVIPRTIALPGAGEAIAAVRDAGGRVVVVTGKYRPNAVLHLAALGFEVDGLVGELWAEQKARALIEHGATVYVGDHLGDVRGARVAGALAVGVPSGPCTSRELLDAGADVVLPSLTGFPSWFRGQVAGSLPEITRADERAGRE